VNCVAWHLDLIPTIVKDKIGDLQSIFTSLASYVGSFATLSRYSRYHESFCGEIDPKLLQLDHLLHRLKLPNNVTGANIDDLYISKITDETHPGCVTRMIAKQVTSGYKRPCGNRTVKKQLV